MKRAILVIVALALLAGFFRLVPLFHLVPLRQTQQAAAGGEFNVTNAARAFWDDQLLKSLDRAAAVQQVLSSLGTDAAKARTQYGRTLGISTSTLFFLSGTGRVVAVKKNAIALALGRDSEAVDILLPTGRLFGNTVRDATGLLDASAFPNSQHFNDLSTELNHLVENTVLPQLRALAKPGVAIAFTGCAELEEDADVKPLKIIPIAVKLAAAP